jgi:hypothetical protein
MIWHTDCFLYNVDRKKFIYLMGMAAGVGVAGFFGFENVSRSLGRNNGGRIRITPLPNQRYSKAFLEFCRNNRFQTVEHALRAVQSQDTEFGLEYEV